VAIAMDMTTIYPFESPGGWHLIGRTPLWMFDQRREQPVFLAPGDSLSFSVSTERPTIVSPERSRLAPSIGRPW
jgi:allophanate hydrolase subunit 1